MFDVHDELHQRREEQAADVEKRTRGQCSNDIIASWQQHTFDFLIQTFTNQRWCDEITGFGEILSPTSLHLQCDICVCVCAYPNKDKERREEAKVEGERKLLVKANMSVRLGKQCDQKHLIEVGPTKRLIAQEELAKDLILRNGVKKKPSWCHESKLWLQIN